MLSEEIALKNNHYYYHKAVTSNVTRIVLSDKLSKRLNLFKKSVISLM